MGMAEKIDRAELERALREMHAREGKKPVSAGKVTVIILAFVLGIAILFALITIYDHTSGNFDRRNCGYEGCMSAGVSLPLVR